MDIAW
jgi:transducin (beta)-like 1